MANYGALGLVGRTTDLRGSFPGGSREDLIGHALRRDDDRTLAPDACPLK